MKLTGELKAIALEVDNLRKASQDAAKATAAINMGLKFDNRRVDLVVNRFKSLGQELEAANALKAKLDEAEKAVRAEIAEIAKKDKDKITDQDKQNMADLEKLASKYANQLEKARKNAEELEELLGKTNKNQEILTAVTKKVNDKYKAWREVAEKIANVTKSIYNTLKNIVTESTKVGQELYALSKRYNVSAEDIQLWNRSLQLATGQADLFNSAVDVMIKGLSQIAAGRGVAYRNALRAIGVSYKEIAELTTSEQFENIVEGLASVENASMRNTYAQQLLGEAGQYVSAVLSEGADALEEYKKRAKDFGVITQSGTQALAEMNIKLEQAKSRLSVAKAEIAVALAPAIESLMNILVDTVIPVIKTIAKGLDSLGTGGQIIIGILGILLALAPRVISTIIQMNIYIEMLKQTANGASVALNTLNASLGIIGIIGVALAAIIGISGAIATSTQRAKEATVAYQGLANAANQIVDVGSNAQINSEQTITSASTKTVEMNVEITGKGDTAISDEAAVKVAQLTADEVNKAWGEFVKG